MEFPFFPEDIAVIFRRESWEARADFSQADVHRQVAIVLRTPPYAHLELREPVQVEVYLQRLTDSVRSEGFRFTYLPRDTGTDRELPGITGIGTGGYWGGVPGLTGQVQVEVYLQRLTDSVRSEGFRFTYLPRDTGTDRDWHRELPGMAPGVTGSYREFPGISRNGTGDNQDLLEIAPELTGMAPGVTRNSQELVGMAPGITGIYQE